MALEDDLFQCGEGLHAFAPDDPLDPSGTECRCGEVSLIGVLAVVKGDRKVFLRYLIDTTPSECEPEPRAALAYEHP